ncbi:hypothetical protein TrispH2_001811, partial [Trichoplax sp. H2]
MKRQHPLTNQPSHPLTANFNRSNDTLQYPFFFGDYQSKRKKIQPVQPFRALSQPALQAQ